MRESYRWISAYQIYIQGIYSNFFSLNISELSYSSSPVIDQKKISIEFDLRCHLIIFEHESGQ